MPLGRGRGEADQARGDRRDGVAAPGMAATEQREGDAGEREGGGDRDDGERQGAAPRDRAERTASPGATVVHNRVIGRALRAL